VLNFEYLIDRSLKLIKPFLTVEQSRYLQSISSKMYGNIADLNSEKNDFVIGMGDVNPTNFHIDENKIITHFDFDQCGYGYRVFEIGKFSSSLYGYDIKEDKVNAFVRGYESIRKLSAPEKKVLPHFEMASIIWVMSTHVDNVNRIGYKYFDESFWRERIKRIEVLYDDFQKNAQ